MVGRAFWDGERNERRAGQDGEQGLAMGGDWRAGILS